LLLVAFGAVGALDAVGSMVLVVHFRHPTHSHRRERRALQIIATGMAVIALVTVVVSIHRLADHSHSRASGLGVAVAASSVVVLMVLAIGKGRVGRRIGSRALVADSHVSTMGSFLALLTVAGTIVSTHLGWWWLDPAGSLAVALVAAAVAARHVQNPVDAGAP
jgi:divalent metal cation (Fe/Co/Zn/Cd) transporter